MQVAVGEHLITSGALLRASARLAGINCNLLQAARSQEGNKQKKDAAPAAVTAPYHTSVSAHAARQQHSGTRHARSQLSHEAPAGDAHC